MEGGFGGMRDATGSIVRHGWAQHGFPTTTAPESGRTWGEIQSRVQGP
jgi:hypothetical protein